MLSHICDRGSVQWEIKLEGRVECPAAILGDFSQVFTLLCMLHHVVPICYCELEGLLIVFPMGCL